jgi:AraC family transcriptional regulator
MSVPRDMELRRLRSEIDERRNAIHQILSEGIGESPLPDDLSSEAPTSIPPEHVEFFKRLYRHTDLETIRDGVGGNSDSVNRELSNLAEPLELLTRTALDAHARASEDVMNIPQSRPEVKRETYNRLLAAKEEIDAHFATGLSVVHLARVACLSQYHFLRLFKRVFDVTPHQYIIRKRLEHACELLIETDMQVSEISHKVGFESHGSFTTLFKRIYGIPPAQYRFKPQSPNSSFEER